MHLPRERRKIVGDNSDEDTAQGLGSVTSSYRTEETKATTLKQNMQEETMLTLSSESAASVTTSPSTEGSSQDTEKEDAVLVFPNRPLDSQGQQMDRFICPYCQTPQSFSTDRRWR